MWTALGCACGAIVGAQGVLVVGGATVMAFPKPWSIAKYSKGTPADLDLPYESLTLPNGSRAWLVRGPPGAGIVVICHGRSRSKAWSLPFIRVLGKDHSVLTFDFPGHGECPYGRIGAGLGEADVVDEALELVRSRGFDRVLLYGCSLGGAAALISQGRCQHPLVRGVMTDGTFAAWRDIVDNKVAKFTPGYLRSAVLRVFGWITGRDIRAANPIDYVRNIKVPVHFVHGTADKLVPCSAAGRMAVCCASATVKLHPGVHDDRDSVIVQEELVTLARAVL